MRVLITNSLVLAAISLAPAVAAAPYAATSSVGSYESYPNSTVLAQASGHASIPSTLCPFGRTIRFSHRVSLLDARRDGVINIESLYDAFPFGNIFGPVANLFGATGMDTISENTIPTEEQKIVLDKLHDAFAEVASRFPADISPSPPLPRSVEDVQVVDPSAPLSSLPVLHEVVTRIGQLLSSAGVPVDPTAPRTELQKQVVENLRVSLTAIVEDLAAKFPQLDVLPLNPLDHVRSVQERSMQSIVSDLDRVSLGWVFEPVTSILSSLPLTNGVLSNDLKQEVSGIQAEIAKAVQDVIEQIKDDSKVVHIEHSREEQDRSHNQDHHHEPHGNDHHSHDEHKHDGEHREGNNESRDAQKDNNKPHGAPKDDNRPHDAHKDGNKPHDAHKDGRKSPETHVEDRHTDGPGREGDRCREPRDAQWGEKQKWDDCRHHHDGKDRNEDPALLKIGLGRSH